MDDVDPLLRIGALYGLLLLAHHVIGGAIALGGLAVDIWRLTMARLHRDPWESEHTADGREGGE